MSLARSERHALAETAHALGPDAPTLCGDWTARDLMAHLLVREHSLLGAPGIALEPLSGLTDRAMRRAAAAGFEAMLERFRNPRFTLYALPAVDAKVNPVEFFVHHEDLRRAQPDWQPRVLDPRDEDVIWGTLRLLGRMLVRPVGAPVRLERTDTAGAAVLRKGEGAAVLHGPPSEMVLFLFGRSQQSGLEITGPDEAVRLLREADLGM